MASDFLWLRLWPMGHSMPAIQQYPNYHQKPFKNGVMHGAKIEFQQALTYAKKNKAYGD